MVMPTTPVANFVVRQSGFALSSLDRLFDTMRGHGHSCKLLQWSVARRIRQVVVVLRNAFPVQTSNDDKHLVVLHHASFDFCLNATRNDFNFQRAFLRVTNPDSRPLVIIKFITPLVSVDEGNLRIRTMTSIRWRCRLQVANRRITGNRQQVLLVAIVQIPTKMGCSAHLIVAGDPGMRQQVPLLVKHFQSLRMTGFKTHPLWHARSFHAFTIPGPLFGKIQTCVGQDMIQSRNVTHVNRDLAVVDLALAAAPLTSDANGLLSLFGKGRRIEHDHGVRFTDATADLTRQFGKQRLVVPLSAANEVLQVPAVLIMSIRDRLHVLSIKVRDQTSNVVRSMVALRRKPQQAGKRLNELIHAFFYAMKDLRGNFTLCKHLLLANFKTSIHDTPPEGFHSSEA